jgi:uncharacterized protein YbjT (DUF2867 family)
VILVIGGTGRLGTKIIKLLGRDVDLRVMTRDRRPDRQRWPGVDLVHGDLRDAESTVRALRGVDTVVCTAHGGESAGDNGPRHLEGRAIPRLIDVAANVSLRQFIYVSSASARADSPAEFFRLKAAVEHRLRVSGIPYSILRPTHLMETWSFLGESLVKRARAMVLGSGRNPVSFVAADDVAQVAARLTVEEGEGLVADLGGPQALTLDEVNEVLAAAFGVTVKRHIRLSPAMLRIGGRVLRPFQEVTSRRMLFGALLDTQPQVIDSTLMWRRFDVTPLTFGEWLRVYGPALAAQWRGEPADPLRTPGGPAAEGF